MACREEQEYFRPTASRGFITDPEETICPASCNQIGVVTVFDNQMACIARNLFRRRGAKHPQSRETFLAHFAPPSACIPPVPLPAGLQVIGK